MNCTPFTKLKLREIWYNRQVKVGNVFGFALFIYTGCGIGVYGEREKYYTAK